MPENIEGRKKRAGRKGKKESVTSFYTPDELRLLEWYEKYDGRPTVANAASVAAIRWIRHIAPDKAREILGYDFSTGVSYPTQPE